MKDKQVEAIYECLQEIVDSLCYQPDIPEAHKVSMLNKLNKVAESYYDQTLSPRVRN